MTMTTMMMMMMMRSLLGHSEPCESEGGRVHLQALKWNQRLPSCAGRRFVSRVCSGACGPSWPRPEVAKHTSDTFHRGVASRFL